MCVGMNGEPTKEADMGAADHRDNRGREKLDNIENKLEGMGVVAEGK